MRIIVFISLLLLSGPGLSAQDKAYKEKQQEFDKIKGVFWKLSAFEDTTFPGVPLDKMGIFFQENKIKGFALCNDITGYYNFAGAENKPLFARLRITWRGCSDKAGIEGYFLNLLQRTNDFRVSGNKLILYANNKKLITLKK